MGLVDEAKGPPDDLVYENQLAAHTRVGSLVGGTYRITRHIGCGGSSGPHELTVERDGFTTVRRTISLRVGSPNIQRVELAPTGAQRLRQARADSRRKAMGYANGGSGVAFVLAGVGLFAWNGGRYAEWRDDRGNRRDDLQPSAVSSIQRVDDLAFASVAVGGGLLATGAWLTLTKGPLAE